VHGDVARTITGMLWAAVVKYDSRCAFDVHTANVIEITNAQPVDRSGAHL